MGMDDLLEKAESFKKSGLCLIDVGVIGSYSSICQKDYPKSKEFVLSRLMHINGVNIRILPEEDVLLIRAPLGYDGDSFADKLLERNKVMVTPGSFFGKSCSDYFAIAWYKKDTAELRHATRIIKACLEFS